MPSASLIEAFSHAQERHAAAVDDLVALLMEMALVTVAEVLPGAEVLETDGEMNEDWVFALRIQRVLDAGDGVLFDVAVGHDDPRVEETIDMVGVESLDPLVALTGDLLTGRSSVARPTR